MSKVVVNLFKMINIVHNYHGIHLVQGSNKFRLLLGLSWFTILLGSVWHSLVLRISRYYSYGAVNCPIYNLTIGMIQEEEPQ